MSEMNFNPFSLTGKHILVTGASSGIGRAIAVACSKSGARLLIVGRDTVRLNETLVMLKGEGHTAIEADLTDDSQLKKVVENTGLLDGVVMSAGKGKTLPLQFCDRANFNDVFEINFFSTVELLRLLYKGKKIAKGGSVVAISSMGGTRSFYVGNGVYGASKAALDSYMKFAAKEFAARKIRVNTICPGMINTPFITKGAVTEEQHLLDAQKYPLKRYGEPEDVAYAAVYLLSDAASWVTGTSMIVDGGLSIS